MSPVNIQICTYHRGIIRRHCVLDLLTFYLEDVLNLAGFAVGLAIGIMSLIGYRNTGSPTLFRLSIAFLSISTGFLVVWLGYVSELLPARPGQPGWWVDTLGVGIQTIGYFFIAFSHGIKSFFPKTRYFRSVGVLPIFLVSSVQIGHILRSVSFILLTYGAIETILSYLESKNRGALSVAIGLALLAFGEFMGWYSAVFPESILYSVSLMIKIIGLAALFVPVSRIPFKRIRLE